MTHPAPTDSALLRLARRIRHAPGIGRAEPLWRMLRPLYHRLLERYHGGRGIPLSLGPAGTIHVPATFVHNVIDPLELPMIEVLLPATSPRTCFYDIGASVGLHSLAVGERLDSAGEIHAFEPDLGSALQYWSNTRLLRRRGVPMQLHRCFVAERSRDFDPQRTRTHFTDAELARPGDPMRHLYLADTASAASHPFVALDDYVAAGMRPPSLVKCDIEGAELLFLRGATRVLRECRPLLFLSVHPALLPAFGHTVEDVRSTLSAAGYGWEVIDQEGEIHVRAEPAGA